MKFIFAEKVNRQELLQGDLLVRNDVLRSVLSHAHPYYANERDYTHFLVLTQSCDLVRRNGRPRSRYITLAAARPVTLVIDRFLERGIKYNIDFPVTICKKAKELQAKQLLERLVHNTEDNFFFLKADSHPELVEDLCVFLALSVAVRADHYDECLAAKIGQMDLIFAAKVGWLTGNLYSRIGTPDVEERIPNATEYKESFYESALFNRTAWLSYAQYHQLKEVIREWTKLNPEKALTSETAKELLEKLHRDEQFIVDRVVKLLSEQNLIASEEDVVNAIRNLLLSDQYLLNLIRGASHNN